MIATSHVIIGGAAAVAVSSVTHNPAAALAVGVASHILCDSLPHLDGPIHPKLLDPTDTDTLVWTKGFYAFAITDSLVALIAVLLIWHFKFNFAFFAPFAWGALGGYLVDLVDNFPLWDDYLHQLPLLKQFHAFHKWIHTNWRRYFPEQRYWPLGVATQIVLVVPCLYYLLK